jgi:hypothetical protein
MTHLRNSYPSVPIKLLNRRLHLPSGAILYVRGAIQLDHLHSEGFYDLGESAYLELLSNPKLHFVILFGRADNSFIIPQLMVKRIFEKERVYRRKGKDVVSKEWHFDVWKKQDRHVLKVNTSEIEHDIEGYRNRWDLVADFA